MTQTPIDDFQVSLTLTEYFPLAGVFPPRDGSSTGFYLGEIGLFAGNFDPAGALAAGQLLQISQNTAIFSILGTTYGGNGTTNFALPNLQGVAMISEGQGVGLNPETEGVPVGSSTVTLTRPQTPPDIGGTSQPFDNYQPSLPVRYEISAFGVFPTPDGGGTLDMIGRVMPFAGNFDPGGFLECAGQLLPIAQNTALFSILGTTYGGDGQSTFALPDLRGRDVIGASATDPIGTKVGQSTVSLANNQTPNGFNNSVQPFDNREPSLALNYLIALQGIFPSRDNGSQDFTTPLLGQIIAFAGNFAPRGWAFANGALLPINQNQALFSLLGTTYGGDGRTTFPLPDLRDRTVIGTGNGFTVGQLVGANFPTITAGQLPPIPPPVKDFNGDGKADIVLQNDGSGQTWVWEMNGNAIIGGGNIATPDPGWKVKGVGDVNGDGKADIVLQNDNTGQTWVWRMNGNAIVGGGNVATPDPGWKVKGIGDVNGDGKADIVLQNDVSGQTWVWEMNGNAIVGGGNVATPDPGWRVKAIGDLNGDGKADIVLQNANTGQVWAWEMNGNAIAGGGNVGTVDPGWQVIAAADFTGDSKADILYQNAITGEVGVAEMNGNVATRFNDIGTPDPGWHVKAAADFTGHGGADILLQNDNTGQVWVWGMTGTAITGGGNVATPDPGWHIPVG